MKFPHSRNKSNRTMAIRGECITKLGGRRKNRGYMLLFAKIHSINVTIRATSFKPQLSTTNPFSLSIHSFFTEWAYLIFTFLDQYRRIAMWTWLLNRWIPSCKFAVGVPWTPIKNLFSLRHFFNKRRLALRTSDVNFFFKRDCIFTSREVATC